MQTGYQYARDHGFDVAVQVDGDGQHDPGEMAICSSRSLAGEADMGVGSAFAGGARVPASFARRLGIQLFARFVSLIVAAAR